MRAELEAEKARRLREVEEATKSNNRQQLEEKMNLERLRRTEDTIDKLNHIDYVTNNDFYTENPVQIDVMVGHVPVYAGQESGSSLSLEGNERIAKTSHSP